MRQSTPALSALLLSNNADAIQISRVLESSGFTVARAVDAIVAYKLCKAERFDLAVYDQDVSGAMELASLRSPSSRPRVTVGLLPSSEAKEIAETRLNFIVYRPLNDDLFTRIVRAAYRPIAADRRASLRHKVSINATSCNLLHQGDIRRLKAATIVNLSRTGMCLETSEILPQTARIQLSFLLPDNGVRLRITGTVIWTHAPRAKEAFNSGSLSLKSSGSWKIGLIRSSPTPSCSANPEFPKGFRLPGDLPRELDEES